MIVKDDCSESARPDGSSYPSLFSEYSSSILNFTNLFRCDLVFLRQDRYETIL